MLMAYGRCDSFNQHGGYMPRLILNLLLTLLLLGTAGMVQPAWADGPYRGKVIDTETKEPIEGAVVVAVWMKNVYRIIDSTEVFAEARETLTGKDGEFVIPSYTWTSIFFYFGTQPPEIFIFKPGYGFFPRYQIFPSPRQNNAALLEPFKTHGLVELPKLKTREERVKIYNSYDLGITVPPEKTPNYMKIKNIERKDLGFTGEETR
jgi:hypothetical protein